MKNVGKRLSLIFGLVGALLLSGCDNPFNPSTDSSSNIVDTSSNVDTTSSNGGETTSSDAGTETSGTSGGTEGYECLADSRYPGLDFNTYGETFRNKLSSYITGKTTTYSDCKAVGEKAMAYPNANSSTFIPFYHEAKASEAVSDSGINREHCWPKSRGGNLIETDPIVIRPTVQADNSARGNNFYGNEVSNEFDPASKTANGSSYEGARGESARIILYAACRYYSQGLSLSNNPNDDWTSKKTMGTLKTLLKWNMDYLPTAWEKTVNDRYADMGYARNPFVEHPEYANFIWDTDGLRTSKYVITVCPPEDDDTSTDSNPTDSGDTSTGTPTDSGNTPTSGTDSGTIENDGSKKAFTISNWPSAYGTDEEITTDDVTFVVTNAASGYTSGTIQMKKNGQGVFL